MRKFLLAIVFTAIAGAAFAFADPVLRIRAALEDGRRPIITVEGLERECRFYLLAISGELQRRGWKILNQECAE